MEIGKWTPIPQYLQLESGFGMHLDPSTNRNHRKFMLESVSLLLVTNKENHG